MTANKYKWEKAERMREKNVIDCLFEESECEANGEE